MNHAPEWSADGPAPHEIPLRTLRQGRKPGSPHGMTEQTHSGAGTTQRQQGTTPGSTNPGGKNLLVFRFLSWMKDTEQDGEKQCRRYKDPFTTEATACNGQARAFAPKNFSLMEMPAPTANPISTPKNAPLVTTCDMAASGSPGTKLRTMMTCAAMAMLYRMP
jgi:hypothetical protein